MDASGPSLHSGRSTLKGEMPSESGLQLFRYVSPTAGDQPGVTYHVIIIKKARVVYYSLIKGYEFDSVSHLSQLSVGRPSHLVGEPLRPPFDEPSIAESIVHSRVSMDVGCDQNDWILSEDPEFDLLVLFMAARRNENAEFIYSFIQEMQNYDLLSEVFVAALSDMRYGIYVKTFP